MRLTRRAKLCGYCGTSHKVLCKRAKAGVERVDAIMADIDLLMSKHGVKELTSRQMEERADRLRSIATGVKLFGGKVKPEYDYDR